LENVPDNTESLAGGPQPEVHFAEYWAVVVKRRRLIGICVALALVIGAAVSILSRPTYRATTVLDIEKDKASPVDISSSPQAASYDPEFLPTQTRLMRSREVAERAVRRLNLAENADFNPPKKGIFSFASGGDGEAAPKDAIARTASNVQAGIDIVSVRGTNLVELSYIANSPKVAADVANAIADAYVDWNLEAKYQVVGQASQFLTAQIEQLKTEIDAKEQQLQQYGRLKDIVSVDPQSNGTLQNLETLNKDYTGAVTDRVAKEARYHEVSTARPDAIADTLSNGLVSQLRNEQAKMEREYAEKLNLYKPEWPAMQQLKAQIDKGKQHLDSVIQETVSKAREVARSDYLTAMRREETLKSVLQGQKNEAMALNTNAVEYNNLKVEVETKRALYDTLLKRNAETQVTSRLRGERLSNVRVVDRALTPRVRYRPSYRNNALLSLFFGAAIGILFAFFLEYLDRSLRSPEQIERLLQLPALGVIPAVGSAGTRYGYGYGYGRSAGARKTKKANGNNEKVAIELLPHHQPRSTVSEAYRAFRTALLLSRAGGVKTIAIASSLPAEGKTSTALNLAVVLAQLGKRVLLIDADLHKPRLHEIFRVSNRVGLVSILAESVTPTDVITQTSIPNVFLIPSGPSSPNPSGLLSSPAMGKLLDFTAMNFDFVILDTPPVSPVADAILLGHEVDGVVLTVRGGRTSREHVMRVRDKLLRSKVRILGVLINNLEEEAPIYGRYYDYYGKRPSQDEPYADTPRIVAR
jgi:succinoglycan biosynthesis transport protein ExoP